jgi:beta-lactamase superfamily II metal-dependent hydrolase
VRRRLGIAVLLAVTCVCGLGTAAERTLEIYVIDTEGGKSVLYVAPGGQSMLVDAGYTGFDGRDAKRILAAAKDADVRQIDYLVATHYHQDHIGGISQIAALLPVRHFVDHGKNYETIKDVRALLQAYETQRDAGQYLRVKAGDTIPVAGLRVNVVTASGEAIAHPLAGGERTVSCETKRLLEPDPGENAHTIGMVVEFGRFRLVDLADLYWNQEFDLVCPANKLGTAGVYLTTHHGAEHSGTPQVLDAVRPRVAIMNNGPVKGGAPDTFQTLRRAPSAPDVWQLHRSPDAKEANAPEEFIANPGEACEGRWIKVSAHEDGSFTVSNGRNGYLKSYR